jgi:zinc/manganese transport system substrate-binding protein
VVAAESFWGSIARQLGGDRVRVTTIISGPDADPHDYEPTPADARRVASARYVILNGAGYDPWMARLLAPGPQRGRRRLDVGGLVGVGAGGNPHRWYSPPDVAKVISRITADLGRLEPAQASFYERQSARYTTSVLARYNGLVTGIRAKYAGTPVGASESIFTPLADALGLRLITPQAFLNAISQGTDPTAAAKAQCDAQIRAHQIKVYVFNRQNATPDVTAQVQQARAADIPVVAVTETPVPADTDFQDWQASQMETLDAALAQATRP